MVAWFIIAIATVAVFAFVAVNGVQTVASANDGVGRAEVARRLDAAVTALLARSVSPNGTSVGYLLAGSNANGVNTLPAELSALASTPFGQQVVYCPFGGNESGTASTVQSANGTSYGIQIATKAGKNYVVGGRPGYPGVASNPNLMGWIMAPRTKTSPTPSCNDVRYNPTTRKYEAATAIVRPIIREAGTEDAREMLAREITFFVSASGTGKGFSAADPTSLTAAIDYYRTRQPSSMTILMANGNYTLAAGMLTIAGATRANRGSLTIRGAGTATIDMESASYLAIPGSLQLENVIFDSDTMLYLQDNDTASLTAVTIGAIIVNGSARASATNVTVTSSPSTPVPVIVTDNGGINFDNNTVIAAAPGAYGMALQQSANVQISGNLVIRTNSGGGSLLYGALITSGSSLSLNSAAVSINAPLNAGLYAMGGLSATDTTIQFGASGTQAGIIAGPGSRVALNGGAIAGAAPNLGIIDSGAASLSGGPFLIRGSTSCWFSQAGKGSAFTESPQGTAGNVSTVANDATLPALSDPPTKIQIEAYNAIAKANARRFAARTVNQTAWQCAA